MRHARTTLSPFDLSICTLPAGPCDEEFLPSLVATPSGAIVDIDAAQADARHLVRAASSSL